MVTVTSAQTSAPQSLFAMSQCEPDSHGYFTVGCMARGFSPADSLTFKWTDPAGKQLNDFVQYPAVTRSGDNTKISHLRISKSDWETQKGYKCKAEHSAGNKEISVAPPPPPPDQHAALYLTTPTKTELDNGTATFICLAKQFSPKTHKFNWYQNGELVTDIKADEYVIEKKTTIKEYSATSILQIDAQTWKQPNTKIKCVFEHKAGNEERLVDSTGPLGDCNSITVDIIPPSMEDMLKNRAGMLKCKASGETGFTKIEIKASGNIIQQSPSEDEIEKKDTVELEARIGYEEWSNGTEFMCTVEHSAQPMPIEATYTRENGGNIMRPSVYLLAPPEYREGEKVTLTCYVKDFYPKEVFVLWLANDEPVKPEGYKQNTSVPMQSNDLFSIYSQLTFDSSKWKKGTVYSCVVYHESVEETLRVITRSIDNNSEKPNIVNLSLNTSLPCKA